MKAVRNSKEYWSSIRSDLGAFDENWYFILVFYQQLGILRLVQRNIIGMVWGNSLKK